MHIGGVAGGNLLAPSQYNNQVRRQRNMSALVQPSTMTSAQASQVGSEVSNGGAPSSPIKTGKRKKKKPIESSEFQVHETERKARSGVRSNEELELNNGSDDVNYEEGTHDAMVTQEINEESVNVNLHPATNRQNDSTDGKVEIAEPAVGNVRKQRNRGEPEQDSSIIEEIEEQKNDEQHLQVAPEPAQDAHGNSFARDQMSGSFGSYEMEN